MKALFVLIVMQGEHAALNELHVTKSLLIVSMKNHMLPP